MKKIIITILIYAFFILPVSSKTLKGGVSLAWDNLTQTEITEDINNVRRKIFDGKEISDKDKKDFKQRIKSFRKDSDRKSNLYYATAGGGELPDRIVVPFFYKKYLLAYGIIYKKDLRTCYYYNALGKLFSVEELEKDYGDFPVTSYQYKTNGTLEAVVYNISEVDQYMYKPDKTFTGRWFEENYYNGKGEVKVTRVLPQK